MSNELEQSLLAFRDPIECNGSRYVTRNSSKGALLSEANTLFSYLAKKTSLDSARQAVIQNNIFVKRTSQTRKRCWEILHSRYFPQTQDLGHHPIIALFQSQASEAVKQGVLCYHYLISDLFAYEATLELINGSYHRGLTNIAPRDVHEFLESKTKTHPEINAWSPQTRSSLVSHYLSAIRDFGILEGKVRKRIRRPTVEEGLFLYIVTFLRDCGKHPRDILGSDDFRIFMLSQQEVESKMVEAHRRGHINFRKSGHVISLELPWRSILEYIKNIRQ